MKYVYLAFILVSLSYVFTQDVSIDKFVIKNLFHKFLADHQRSYATQEYDYRFNVFKKNYQKIIELNADVENTATFGITKFMDLTREEFNGYLGFKKFGINDDLCNNTLQVPEQVAPDAYDWRQYGAVTDIKDQGQCGSSWAFPVVGNIEGLWFIKHKALFSLSTQQLLDCDSVDYACNGGLFDQGFDYVKKAGGLESDDKYPYVAKQNTCEFNKQLVVASITGCSYISKQEEVIKNTLYQIGPLAVAINGEDLQFYTGGIYKPAKGRCSPENVSHGMLLVGYGVEKNLLFWIIKNTFGKSWGENGYYRLVRGVGACGVNTYVSTGVTA